MHDGPILMDNVVGVRSREQRLAGKARPESSLRPTLIQGNYPRAFFAAGAANEKAEHWLKNSSFRFELRLLMRKLREIEWRKAVEKFDLIINRAQNS